MDFDSRNLYREKLVRIAARSDFTEMEVALEVLVLARRAQEQSSEDTRLLSRESHVGYYLVGEGVAQLCERVRFRPSLIQRIRTFLRGHPDEFYLPGIEVLTFGIMSAVVLALTSTVTSPALILFAMLVLLLPSSQSVENTRAATPKTARPINASGHVRR